jgi:hypothetical protein
MPTFRVFHVVKPLPLVGSGSNSNPKPFQGVGTVAKTIGWRQTTKTAKTL